MADYSPRARRFGAPIRAMSGIAVATLALSTEAMELAPGSSRKPILQFRAVEKATRVVPMGSKGYTTRSDRLPTESLPREAKLHISNDWQGSNRVFELIRFAK